MNNQQLREYVFHRNRAETKTRSGRLSKIMMHARRAAKLHGATLGSGFGVRAKLENNPSIQSKIPLALSERLQ